MFIRFGGTGLEPLRFLLALVTTSAGWIIVGVGLLIGGLIWGLNSQQTFYQTYAISSNYQISTGTVSGNVYINANGSNEYFVGFFFDFAPNVNPDDLDKAAEVSFVARADTSTLNPPLTIANGTTITAAHKIEQFELFDQNGKLIREYTSAEYRANPNGYSINYWPYASVIMFTGVACVGTALFLLIRRRQSHKLAVQAELARLEARPSPFARELGEMDQS